MKDISKNEVIQKHKKGYDLKKLKVVTSTFGYFFSCDK
jgi:hypothetical protein